MILLIGVSYSIYNYTFTGNKNVIETDGVELELLESNENIIEISNALPITDEKGMTQEKTFDFAVTSRTKRDMDIPYNLYIEKLDVLCSSIESASEENNPDCYDLKITEQEKNDIIAFLEEGFGSTAAVLYNSVIAHDKEGIYYFLISKGASAEDATEISNEIEANGYEKWLIANYEKATGKEINESYEFNGNNYDYSNSLSDLQIKIYLTDYEGNKILGPVKVSELSEYALYNGIHEHNKENGEIKDKFKLRAWIDYDVDVSDWTEDTNLEYRFKIGVKEAENAATLVSGEKFQEIITDNGYSSFSFKTVTFVSGEAIDTSKAEKVFDVSEAGEGSVLALVVDDEMMPLAVQSITKNLFIITNRDILYANPDCSYMFSNFEYLQTIDVTKLNTSKVIDMSRMFKYVGDTSSTLDTKILGIENWNTSNVRSTWQMFNRMRYLSNINLSGWDTSNVINANEMFCNTGLTPETLVTGDKWDLTNAGGNEAPITCK